MKILNCDSNKCVEATNEATNLVIYEFTKSTSTFNKITNLINHFAGTFFVNCPNNVYSVIKTPG